MAASAYDRVPYESHAQAETWLDVLAAQATLFGMRPAPPGDCRALFIGCASGWNMLPMAALLPGTRFVGMDQAAAQVESGRADAALLGLKNVELLVLDVVDATAELGEFDYIIVHGVYSWVPARVQAAILRTCKENLAAHGVAYVSYNCKPGWQMRGLMRDMMRLHVRGFDDPADQVRQARAMLGFLGRAAQAAGDGSYGRWLGEEVKLLDRMGDFYLLHEHLAPANEAVWFHEFSKRVGDSGLQYLGEPTLAMMMGRGLPARLREELDAATGDLIQAQQYQDIASGRHFRRSLVVHRDIDLDRQLNWRSLMPLRIASPTQTEADAAALQDNSEVVFRRENAELASSTPSLKRALWRLGHVWPESIGFTELAAAAALGGDPDLESTQRVIGRDLLNAAASGFVDLGVAPRPATPAGRFPYVPGFMRLQAERGLSLLTTALHQPLAADETMRTLIRLCDGTRDLSAIQAAMTSAATEALLTPNAVAQPEVSALAGPMASLTERTLLHMERNGVFVAAGSDHI